MAIRYDKKLNQEINRVVRNFNNKVRRLSNLESNYILPQRASVKELKQSVYTRTELKRKLNELQRFSKRGAEETVVTASGFSTSRYELENLKRESARVKRNLSIQLKKLEMTSPTVFGKPQSATFSQMGDSFYLNIKTKREALNKDLNMLTREEIQRYSKLVSKIGRSNEYMNSIFKQNYNDILTNIGYYTGYDNEKLKLLESKLNQLSPQQFYKLFQNEKAIKSIVDYYPISTGGVGGFNPNDIKDDVETLYDNLINNIDSILDEYL